MNTRHRRFVDEYLIDLNATQAAIRAGYSEKTARSVGQRLLTYADISAAIDADQAERSKRTQVTQDYVLANLTEVVERCMQRAPVMVRRGKEMVQATDDEDRHVWQFDARNANGALGLLGKHLGMYIEKREITTPSGSGVLAVPVAVTAEQWGTLAAAQQAALVAKPDGEPT